MSEFKSDYYEYSIEWAWEYEEWAEARIAKLQAEVKLQSDSADHWEDEAMNHMSQAAKLQAVAGAAKAVLDKHSKIVAKGDLSYVEHESEELENLKRAMNAIKEVEK